MTHYPSIHLFIDGCIDVIIPLQIDRLTKVFKLALPGTKLDYTMNEHVNFLDIFL